MENFAELLEVFSQSSAYVRGDFFLSHQRVVIWLPLD